MRTEEADLVDHDEGTGPVLLAIAGGGGDGARYTAISAALADGYRVVRYDRRGRARSTAGPSPGFDLAQQARDAAAVIRVFGEQAYVFGNSSGANIGLALMSDHPELVTALVAHEPPVTGILPDADAWLSFVDEVHDAYLAGGFQAAMRIFAGSLTGMDESGSRPEDDDSRPADESQAEAMKDLELWMRYEYHPVSRYIPDLALLTGRPVTTAAGRASGNAYYARTARVIAERTGCRYIEFPGHQLAFQSEPDAFAGTLRQALALSAR